MASEIILFTDGAASGNPGPGGYGVVLKSGSHYLEKSAGFALTTNNRMELLAVIIGLESLKIQGSRVTVYTDSKYVADPVSKGWLFKWEATGFRKKKNIDLWKRFLKVYNKHTIKFVWIKGHSAIPENERCDQLAVEASRGKNLPIDEGYVYDKESDELPLTEK